MYTIPSAPNPLSLFHVDGGIRKFESKAVAVKQLGKKFISNNLRKEFKQYKGYDELFDGNVRPAHKYCDYIMRDSFGDHVEWSLSDFCNRVEVVHVIRKPGSGPIEGAGRGRFRYSDICRSRKVNRDRRNSQSIDEDEPAPRSSRGSKMLALIFGGAPRTDAQSTTWKKFRKTQNKSGGKKGGGVRYYQPEESTSWSTKTKFSRWLESTDKDWCWELEGRITKNFDHWLWSHYYSF